MTFDRVIAVRNAKTVYRNGEICIKVFNEGYKKSDVVNEALNHVRIEETGVEVPDFVEVKEIDDKWSIVTKYVKGKTLDSLMRENPDRVDRYIDRFTDIHKDIMEKRCEKLNKLVDKLDSKICDVNLDATLRFDLHARLAKMEKRDDICHGDFNPTNIIITEDDKAYIVDWSYVCKGNGIADIVNTYLTFIVKDQKELAEKYLVSIRTKMKISKEEIDEWIPIIAAAKSVDAHRDARERLLEIYEEYRKTPQK